jgi:preprotein translocase subunit SecA
MPRHHNRRRQAHRHTDQCDHDDFEDEDEEFEDDFDDEDEDDSYDKDDPFNEPLVPIRNTTPKIGRNDPCPCGSGKKYKKCHI